LAYIVLSFIDKEIKELEKRLKARNRFVNDTYNLRLTNTENINYQNLEDRFEKVIESNCQGKKISKTFVILFQTWLKTPELSLREEAYVLLSNWFLTEKHGVKGSPLAINTELLWEQLFCYKPTQRLSSSKPGEHHKVLPQRFGLWWPYQLKCQENL